MPRLPLIFFLLAASCAQTAPERAVDVFVQPGSAGILGAETREDRERIHQVAAFLNEHYGYLHDGSHRDLRDLKDLIDRPELMAGLKVTETLSFGSRLTALGYHLKPRDARVIFAGVGGPANRALEDPAVRALLADLATEDLLAEDAGRNALHLSAGRAEGLVKLAHLPDGASRVRSFAESVPYRFRPADALPLLEEAPLTAREATFLTEVAALLHVELRPGQLPELHALAAQEERTWALLELSERAKVRLSGPGAILVLARLLRDEPPLTEAEADRLEDLAGRLIWPDAGEFLYLVPLCRPVGIEDLISELEDRYRYRFEARDAAGLILLHDAGLPDPALPAWIRDDRVTLIRPELLLSPEPATAFTGENDLRFMESLKAMRPDFADRPPAVLARQIRKRLRGREVRYRLGAPYPETADDLSGFLRPDLLKILLLLDELDRPETVARLGAWIEQDVRDPVGEMGGYLRLVESGRLEFELYAGDAGTARDDRLRLPPDPAGAALEFHFHATDGDDESFAGPSSGGPGTDLFRAAHHRLDGAVFTLLPDGRFDTDVYTSRKTVLDLGVSQPPSKR
jgi:hypothetical protein